MLQYLNQNIVDKRIIITLRNWSLKCEVKPLISGRLFPWLLLRLKPTTEIKCLVMAENLIHVRGPNNSCIKNVGSLKAAQCCFQCGQLHSSLKWTVETCPTIHVNSGTCLYCSGRTGSGPKLNALNRVRPSKKN
jgi:hypothetical protein